MNDEVIPDMPISAERRAHLLEIRRLIDQNEYDTPDRWGAALARLCRQIERDLEMGLEG